MNLEHIRTETKNRRKYAIVRMPLKEFEELSRGGRESKTERARKLIGDPKAKLYLYREVRGAILENRIKKMRKLKGWTQTDLAKRMGVTQAQVAKWESNRANPSRKTLVKLASIFGCEPGYLV
jgi:DNA-binding XRE family transcriptional regulator